MPELILYFAPDSCARVTLMALEEIGCPYSLEVVSFMNRQHRSPEYLAMNPGGKVPTLVIDGRPLTENVAILSWLASEFPEAGLMPPASGLDHCQQLADLAYCASGLHPIVTRLRVPNFLCDHPQGRDRVFEMAEIAMTINFRLIEERLSRSTWWYGEQWSVLDHYLNWVWFRVSGTAFDVTPYPNFSHHAERLKERPAYRRALKRNDEVAASLAAQGLAIKFDGPAAARPAAL